MGKTTSYTTEEKTEESGGCCACFTIGMKKISDTIAHGLELLFYKLGVTVASHPFLTILFCFIVFVAFAPGAINLEEETRRKKLWTPSDTEALDDDKWVQEYFPDSTRLNYFMITADNVLEPDVLRAMIEMDRRVKAIEREDDYTWETICTKVADLCLSTSILEVWSFNQTVINQLTSEDILRDINNVTHSPYYQSELILTKLLGQLERDDSGRIVGATAAVSTYYLASKVHSEVVGQDPRADRWEDDFQDVIKQAQGDFSGDVDEIFYFMVRSFDDEAGGAIFDDIYILTAGYCLVFTYVAFMLGKFNWIQQRIYLTMSGVLCVGMAFAFSMGLCTYADIMYTQIHNVIPFLLIGIGMDDMFVMVQSYENLPASAMDLPLPERVGLMMKHAGSSITVTSLTDILALGVGATTIIPALSAFCIYTVIGIAMTFVFQVTLFVAVFTLDQRRQAAWRNSVLCCYVHEEYKVNECSQKSMLQRFFENIYAPFLMKLPVKVLVVLISAGMLGWGIYGTTQLTQNFDPYWFLPSDSYAFEYLDTHEELFPDEGVFAAVYIEDVDYYEKSNFSNLIEMYETIESDEYVRKGSTDAWYMSYQDWLEQNENRPEISDGWPTTEDSFYNLLWEYLCGEGFRYKEQFNLTHADSSDPLYLNCSGPTQDFRIKASRVPFWHIRGEDSSEKIAMMDQMRDNVEECGGGRCRPYTFWYVVYEADRIIKEELYRNLGFAFLCIIVMTLLLICDIVTSIFVSACVIMSVVDVAGMMYYWDMTIDTVTTIQLIIALGLTIDYAAHIGHIFMTIKGTRNKRAEYTLLRIGPAVWNGGVSTFLAFVLLASSTSYVFRMFFRILLGVVAFGLFHGLAFLPVILSWFGLSPYSSAIEHNLDKQEAGAGKSTGHMGNGRVGADENKINMESHGNGVLNPAYGVETEEGMSSKTSEGNSNETTQPTNDAHASGEKEESNISETLPASDKEIGQSNTAADGDAGVPNAAFMLDD